VGGVRPVVVLGSLAALLLWSCSGCPASPPVADADAEACSVAACQAWCRTFDQCYTRCRDGICSCVACGSDADADAEDATGGDDADRSDDGDVDRPEDGSTEDAAACAYRTTGETRAGASPGVTCRRLSVDEVEHGLLHFSGFGERVVLIGGDPGSPLWEVRPTTGCLMLLDDSATAVPGRYAVNLYPSVDGGRLAYVTEWWPSSDTKHCEMRFRDLATGLLSLFAGNESIVTYGQQCFMDYAALEYPWIVWRDVREHPLGAGPGTVGLYNWDAVALNVETGEIINLSLDPDTGTRVWGSVVRTDLDGGWAVFEADWGGAPSPDPLHEEIVAVNLATRERRQITDAAGDQYFPTVSVPWVAWVDDRAGYPDCDSMSPCFNDIYGYNLETREERALVVADDSMQGDEVDAEGPWLVYEDQRGGTDPTHDRDREEDIFAFHLPTMTEIRVTDWPGYEMLPRVYRRDDGSYGALFVYEISYAPAIYRLWDCDLPEP
jgi:hypothetical protein